MFGLKRANPHVAGTATREVAVRRVGIAVGAVVLALLPAAPASAAEVAWTKETPAFSWMESSLQDAVGVGDDVWTVGYQGQVTYGNEYLSIPVLWRKPLVQRYTSGHWDAFDLPGLFHGGMAQVAASGPRNVWVSGVSYVPWLDGTVSPYFARWDGSAWTQVQAPKDIKLDYIQNSDGSGVSVGLAVAPDATFAVNPDTRKLEVYAGGTWTVDERFSRVDNLVSHPNGGTWIRGVLNGETVTARWVSGSWQPIPLPEGVSSLKALYPLATDYLLAYTDQKRYARWDGTAWSSVGPDNAPQARNAALSPSGTPWLAELRSYQGDVELPVLRTYSYMYRLDGSAWSQVPLPAAGNLIYGLTSTPSKIWAVGEGGKRPVAATTAG